MTIKFTGSFGPITGAMSAGDTPPPPVTFHGLEWNITDNGYAEVNVVDDTQYVSTVMIGNPAISTSSGTTLTTKIPLIGDFDIGLEFILPNNSGFVVMDLFSEALERIPMPANYFLLAGAHNDYISGAPMNEIGFPSHSYTATGTFATETLRITRTGGNSVQGFSRRLNTGVWTYSDPLILRLRNYKNVPQLNTTDETALIINIL